MRYLTRLFAVVGASFEMNRSVLDHLLALVGLVYGVLARREFRTAGRGPRRLAIGRPRAQPAG